MIFFATAQDNNPVAGIVYFQTLRLDLRGRDHRLVSGRRLCTGAATRSVFLDMSGRLSNRGHVAPIVGMPLSGS